VVIVVRYEDAEGKVLSETEGERVLDEPARKWLSEQKRTVNTPGRWNGGGPGGHGV